MKLDLEIAGNGQARISYQTFDRVYDRKHLLFCEGDHTNFGSENEKLPKNALLLASFNLNSHINF